MGGRWAWKWGVVWFYGSCEGQGMTGVQVIQGSMEGLPSFGPIFGIFPFQRTLLQHNHQTPPMMTIAVTMTIAANDADDADQQSSISELIAMHSRERLFVHPLLWTQRQLHLLGCTFADGGILTPTPIVCAMPPSPRCTALMTAVQRDMADRFSNASKARSLATGKRIYGKWWSLIGLLQEVGRYKFAFPLV